MFGRYGSVYVFGSEFIFSYKVFTCRVFLFSIFPKWLIYSSKNTMWLQRHYNVAVTSRRCSDVVTTLLRRREFAGMLLIVRTSDHRSEKMAINSYPKCNLIGLSIPHVS